MSKVSIIMPCYNQADFLAEAVGSAANQTFQDVEIIIIDDGSPDNTSNVAKDLIKMHPDKNIRLITQTNTGLPGARNRGFAEASADYVVPLDADDILMPQYVEMLLHALTAEPGAALAYSWTEKFGTESGVDRHGPLDRKTLLKHTGPSATAMIRKGAWEKAGGYKPVMDKGFEDWEFLMSLYEAGYYGVCVPEVLFMYRKKTISRDVEVFANHSLKMQRNIKLLHPALFEPLWYKIHPALARAVIRIKSRTRDPLSHFLYVRLPLFHRIFRKTKYSIIR